MTSFPLGYLEDFLEFLVRNRDTFEVITYADLPWSDDWRYERNYPGEYRAWKRALRSGMRDPGKIYLLLQHDVDAVPQRTMALLAIEERLGLRSNVMVFHQCVHRGHLEATGAVRYTRYIEDFGYLQSLAAKGFVIGYHCNAYERAGFDRARAIRVMEEDVAALSAKVPIAFMSGHGGARGPDGKSNPSLAFPPALSKRVRWVHNGHSIRMTGTYSDGGIDSERRAPEALDLRRFVEQMRPGGRYRILLHPQYYSERITPKLRLRSQWYDEVLDAYARSPRRNLWESARWGRPRSLAAWKDRLVRLVSAR